jgi:tRNA-splicing endonuclease subunit Sen34
MAESDSISEPIPISLISGRYLLFDVNVVTYLRRTHHICGVLIGSIPQAPQQNTFLGLPVELLPEEAKLLVEKEVAYIVDDTAWHKNFLTFDGEDKQKYLKSLRSEGIKARKTAQQNARKRTELALAKKASAKAREISDRSTDEPNPDDSILSLPDSEPQDDISSRGGSVEPSLFSEDPSETPPNTVAFRGSEPYAITPTTTYSPHSLPQNPSPQPDPTVPSSYPLFAHLHSKGYFLMPGLRFGSDYNVYPGDPLRFHSHFLATGYEWDQDIPLLDLIGGGRLGTSVKKGFLIGGEDTTSESEVRKVRTFSLEWGGM